MFWAYIILHPIPVYPVILRILGFFSSSFCRKIHQVSCCSAISWWQWIFVQKTSTSFQLHPNGNHLLVWWSFLELWVVSEGTILSPPRRTGDDVRMGCRKKHHDVAHLPPGKKIQRDVFFLEIYRSILSWWFSSGENLAIVSREQHEKLGHVQCFKGIISTDQIRTVRDDQTSNSNHPSMLANHWKNFWHCSCNNLYIIQSSKEIIQSSKEINQSSKEINHYWISWGSSWKLKHVHCQMHLPIARKQLWKLSISIYKYLCLCPYKHFKKSCLVCLVETEISSWNNWDSTWKSLTKPHPPSAPPGVLYCFEHMLSFAVDCRPRAEFGDANQVLCWMSKTVQKIPSGKATWQCKMDLLKPASKICIPDPAGCRNSPPERRSILVSCHI